MIELPGYNYNLEDNLQSDTSQTLIYWLNSEVKLIRPTSGPTKSGLCNKLVLSLNGLNSKSCLIIGWSLKKNFTVIARSCK